MDNGNRRSRVARRWGGPIAILLIALAYAMPIQQVGWNQTSHFALIRAISRGTPHIDPYAWSTGDKVRDKGHWYSSRAPGLAFFTLPAYKVAHALGVDDNSGKHLANKRHGKRFDEAIWFLGLWAAVLPAALILLLVRWMAERLEPGYGTAAAVALGLGTLILPFATLLFSHVFSALLGFAAFALLWRERERGSPPPRLLSTAVAGLLVGYGFTTEYPLFIVGLVLGVYVLATFPDRVKHALAFIGGGVLGIVPLMLYDKWAFGSFTHVAYADLPRHQSGFFGIRPPSFETFITLLFSSRGLLILSPVLLMGAIGTVLLYRRGHRAEALVITGVVAAYLLYNSGYYLPFGGGTPGPRFLATMLPFLAVPLALAWRRFPAQTLALAAISVVIFVLATITHPLIGYETETAVWTRYATKGLFQPSILTAFGAGRGWIAPVPFLLLAVAGVVLAVRATPRSALSRTSLGIGAGIAGAWALVAIVAPTWLGIDHRALENTHNAGDPKALHLPWGRWPLTHLGLVALGASLALLALAAFAGRRPRAERTRVPVAVERA
jgi:hypothetical protein